MTEITLLSLPKRHTHTLHVYRPDRVTGLLCTGECTDCADGECVGAVSNKSDKSQFALSKLLAALLFWTPRRLTLYTSRVKNCLRTSGHQCRNRRKKCFWSINSGVQKAQCLFSYDCARQIFLVECVKTPTTHNASPVIMIETPEMVKQKPQRLHQHLELLRLK